MFSKKKPAVHKKEMLTNTVVNKNHQKIALDQKKKEKEAYVVLI